METKYTIVNGELYHYGIKGMKWGVRRYQNPDGSLTPAGRKRLRKEEKKLDRLNSEIFEKRLMAKRALEENDPATPLFLSELSRQVSAYTASGESIVKRMKQKGLLSNNVAFTDYTAKYETRIINNCKQAITKRFGIDNPSDELMNEYMLAYVFGAV